MEGKDIALLEGAVDNTLDVLVDAIASSIPGLNIAWGLTKAYCGAGLRLRQERAIQYIELIRDNPDIFTEQLFQNELFQDAFVYGMENYIRLSLESKRDIAKKILIGLATTNEKEKFSFERYYNVLNIIDYRGLEYLSFLKKTVAPAHAQWVEDKIPGNLKDFTSEEEARRKLYRQFNMMHSLHFGYFKGMGEFEPEEGLFDLHACGIIFSTHSGTIGGGDTDYILTEFGYDFLEFI